MNGGRVRVFEPTTGPSVGACLHIVETSDWKAFGEYRTKLERSARPKRLVGLAHREPGLWSPTFASATM